MSDSAHDFDVLVLGGGIGGLATAALLARAGVRVGLVERQETLGGYAHSFQVEEFDFCHQVQYLMGCEEGGPMQRFLQRLGLDAAVRFNYLDAHGYDVVVTPDLRFAIPSGTDTFCASLIERFPSERDKIQRYFRLTSQIWSESHAYERVVNWTDVAKAPWRHMHIMRHMRQTLGQVFDQLGLSQELRVVLAGQAGNLSVAPAEASFLMHCGMQEAYARSAAYPKAGMRDMIARIAAVIEAAPGCRIMRGCKAQRILTRDSSHIEAVLTDAGRITAGRFISNLDPALTYSLVAEQSGPRLSYKYSDAVVALYLGFKGTDLRMHGFGRRNFWYHSHHDLDREFFALTREHDYREPWVFLSTPSLLADPGTLCDDASSSLVMLTFIDHAHVKDLERRGGSALSEAMQAVAESFWRILERHFLPNARKLATAVHLETPLDVERRLAPPQCNVYGARLTPENYNMRRVTSRSRFANLSFANATAFYPGVMPIVVGSMQLVDRMLAAGMATGSGLVRSAS